MAGPVLGKGLAFVARRLQAESVVLLFAEREPGQLDELARLPDLPLRGLPTGNAHELLASAISGPLDHRVRDRILAEAHGNPLALLELPHELSPAELAGEFGLPGGLPLSGRIKESFLRRAQQLPAATQRLLLVAAAETTGEPILLWQAARTLGIPAEAAGPAQADGLLDLGAQVAFRHSLLRSAVYRAAAPDERRSAHLALAAATDAETDPTAGPGTAPTRRLCLTRTSPTSWSARRGGPNSRRASGGRCLPGGGGTHTRSGTPGAARALCRSGQAPGRSTP